MREERLPEIPKIATYYCYLGAEYNPLVLYHNGLNRNGKNFKTYCKILEDLFPSTYKDKLSYYYFVMDPNYNFNHCIDILQRDDFCDQCGLRENIWPLVFFKRRTFKKIYDINQHKFVFIKENSYCSYECENSFKNNELIK